MYIYTPARHRRSGTTMQKHRPPSAQAKLDRPRRVLPGYPADPFKTVEEVEAHVGGDKVACLMCGKYYKSVLIHAKLIHDMDAADYRLRFNIPSRFSLNSVETIEKQRAKALQPDNMEMIRQIGLSTRGVAPKHRRYRVTALGRANCYNVNGGAK